jgi:hypothetical protein
LEARNVQVTQQSNEISCIFEAGKLELRQTTSLRKYLVSNSYVSIAKIRNTAPLRNAETVSNKREVGVPVRYSEIVNRDVTIDNRL